MKIIIEGLEKQPIEITGFDEFTLFACNHGDVILAIQWVASLLLDFQVLFYKGLPLIM